jgi:hypothetical protein
MMNSKIEYLQYMDNMIHDDLEPGMSRGSCLPMTVGSLQFVVAQFSLVPITNEFTFSTYKVLFPSYLSYKYFNPRNLVPVKTKQSTKIGSHEFKWFYSMRLMVFRYAS